MNAIIGVVEYRVLSGDVEVFDDAGERMAIGGARQTALLAALVARARRVVSTDELVHLLWNDNPPKRPANAVQVLVSRLRSQLRTGVTASTDLETRPRGYMLDIDSTAVDAGRFEQLVGDARVASPQDRVELLGAALGLWRGRAYGRHADDDIARLEALRLEDLRRGAEVDLGAALAATDRPDEAIAVLDPFVTEHPLHEGARAALMRAMYAQGRHADALRSFQDYRSVLTEELGLEPSESLRRLELDILRHQIPDAPPLERTRTEPTLASMTVRHVATEAGPVAWTRVGAGPRLTVVPAWVTSLDVMASGRDPRSALVERLTRVAEVVLYDRRGAGLSEGPVEDFSVEAACREAEAVLEASGGPATLLAMSQAGPTALALARARPDLVDRLVLVGTFASGPETFSDSALSSALLGVVRSHWGVGSRLFAGLYRPDASDAVTEYLARVLQDSAPQEIAAGYLETVYTTDVSSVLGEIACPTLVIHYRNDRVVPFAGGRQLAASIPGAELLILEGPYHLPHASDLDTIAEAITGFLAS